jgi:hypothetical protein
MVLLTGSSINTVHEVVLTVTNVFIPKRDPKQPEASGIAMSEIHLPICAGRTKSTPVTIYYETVIQHANQPIKKANQSEDLYEAKLTFHCSFCHSCVQNASVAYKMENW